ncbi:MAG: HlyD family efflux transporter periplasmic adaptor subunit [Planctomycetes bacterium]|nr:HlyD family efflux transporter periplasmic adaptor subunit [Planctomycetota bacterium]
MTHRTAFPRSLAIAHRTTALVLALGLPLACTGKHGPAKEDTQPKEKRDVVVRVRVSPMKRRPIDSAVETIGSVEARFAVQVFPKMPGLVEELDVQKVEQGRHVDREQVLARVEDDDAQLALDNAQAALRESEEKMLQLVISLREARAQLLRAQETETEERREYEQSRRQSTTGLAAQDLEAQRRFTWEQAKRDVQIARIAADRAYSEIRGLALAIERARLDVAVQQENLSKHEILAPFAGIIAKRNIQLGQLVATTTAAFDLYDPEQLVVRLDRPQQERSLIHPGQLVEILPSRSELDTLRRASGKSPRELMVYRQVSRIAPSNDPGGTFQVTIGEGGNPFRNDVEKTALRTGRDVPTFEDPRGRDGFDLYPGRTIRLRIVLDRHEDPFLVPKKAILREGATMSVFVQRDGVAKRVALSIGYTDDTHAEVLNVAEPGEAPGDDELGPEDRIIVLGMDELEDGTKVEIVEE